MNPASISFWVTIVKDALTGLAAVAAVALGVLGLKTWERQLLGTADHEVSRRLLRATYRLREAIQILRSPWFVEFDEMVAASKAAGRDVDTTDSREQEAFGYERRWKKVLDAIVEFDAEMLEAEALWGSEVHKCEESLTICLNRLRRSLEDYWALFHLKRLDADAQEKVRDIILDSGDTNTFSAELKSAFKQIEAMIRPHLKPYNPKRKG
jgi:hypothetical protein